jgi:septation ring formation regulator EzrA
MIVLVILIVLILLLSVGYSFCNEDEEEIDIVECKKNGLSPEEIYVKSLMR